MFRQKKSLFDGFDNLTIVTPSEWLANKVKLSFLRDKAVAVIPNGIDQNIFKPTDYIDLDIYPFIKDKKMILSVASDIMSENKGGQRIIEVAKELENESIIFVLVGAKVEYKNQKNIIFMEKTRNQVELAKLYTYASALLVLSKSESFSLVIAEALSCGTPVIGYDVGGIRETASKGHGFFTEYGNKNQIKNYILDLENKYSKRKEIFQNYIFVHSKERMNNEYLRVYSENLILR
jgi:glycosyltransferase involved in cell wall biosynthesis